MISISSLVNYLNEQLQPHLWRDYCPNGKQVAGCEEVQTIITAVSASQEVLDTAVRHHAQAVLVHHGFFWQGEDPCVRGLKKNRLTTLLTHNINLLAYHLPLDGHTEWGNNVQLGKILNIHIAGEFAYSRGPALALIGDLPSAMTGEEFAAYLAEKLQRPPFWIAGGANKIKRLAWSTGAAQDLLEEAAAHKVDAFLTGEVSERTTYIAQETGLHFYAAGHHATERYGIQALGQHLAEQFNLQHLFIDTHNLV